MKEEKGLLNVENGKSKVHCDRRITNVLGENTYRVRVRVVI